MSDQKQTGLPWPEIEYDNDTGPDDEGFWEWWEIPGVAKFNLERDAIIARTAVNERPNLLERVRKMEEALRKARGQVVAFAIPQIGAESATKSVAYIDAALSE